MINNNSNSNSINNKSLGDIVFDLNKRNSELIFELAQEKYKNQCLIAELKAINAEINEKLSSPRKSSKYSIYKDIKKLSRTLNIIFNI